MLYYGNDFNIIKNKFFNREVTFNKFRDISDDRIDEIKVEVDIFFNHHDLKGQDQFGRYIEVINYLGSEKAHYKLPTFDEQILFYIFACDSELKTLKIYLDSGIISQREIEASPESEQLELSVKRCEQLHAMSRDARSAIGFYDAKLLKYESIYVAEVLGQELLNSNIGYDATTPLLTDAYFITHFDTISDEDFEMIKEVSENYKISVKDPQNIHTLSYNILAKKKLVKLNSLKKMIVLIIYTIDPELKMLSIYEEESREDEIKRRCEEEFGYYNMDLIRLERAYHKRFCPDKPISIWSDERKLTWTQD